MQLVQLQLRVAKIGEPLKPDAILGQHTTMASIPQ
jgi:hypothetical protein